MDERAAIPVELPYANPTVSYWQDPPSNLADYQSSEGLPEEADIVIIGSGITGAGIAWNLLQQNAKEETIVMLEARQACSGATGRNGGHTKAASYRSFPSNASTLGLEAAVKIARFEYDTIRSVHAFARERSIDCDSWQGDTVDIIYDHAQWVESLTAIQQIRDAMSTEEDLKGVSRYQIWSESEALEKFHVKGEKFAGAISYEAGSLSAYKFVTGVLSLCLLHAEFSLYTHHAVITLSREEEETGVWSLKTSNGAIKAKTVVLATNGYTAALHSSFQGKIVPLRGQVTAHRPGSSMPRNGLGKTYSFIYSNGYEYMIPRPAGSKFEGDIIIGGGLTKAQNEGIDEFGTCDDSTINRDISRYLFSTTERYFGLAWGDDHPEGRIRREWTGIMGYSVDGFPFVGEVDGKEEGLWVAASFQGHGMVLCWGVARALALMIEGKDRDRDGEELNSWFPGCFKMGKKRLEGRFEGRLHTSAKADEEASYRD